VTDRRAVIKRIRFLPTAGDRPPDASAGLRIRAGAVALPGLPPPRFAAVEMAWSDGAVPAAPEADAIVVAVEEVVLRGADELQVLRAGDRPMFTMMSVARRNPALTRAELAERWRAEAGRVGAEVIPDDVRGLAYVQDHPLDDAAPFDAINEAWFDSLDALRRRADWFASRPVPAELFDPDECFALYLRVEPAP